MKERDTNPGDIIETPNGTRYLILPNRKRLYMGHKELHCIPQEEMLKERPESDCKVISRVEVTWNGRDQLEMSGH